MNFLCKSYSPIFFKNLNLVKKIYHLSTCNTCQRILKELQLSDDVVLQDIKEEAITAQQLEAMKILSGSYEALFSKRARLYREKDLKNQNLTEDDFKNYILEHYTFLKRPVMLVDDQIFIGNAAKTVAAAKEALA
jgi:arsenate reductase